MSYIATFKDGYRSQIDIRGDYGLGPDHTLIGLAHNRKGFARVIFIQDNDPTSGRSIVAHDPWLNCVEPVTIN